MVYGIVAEDYPKTLMELEGRFSSEDTCLDTVCRYERSGVLHGLLRVWGFTQADAHIICGARAIRFIEQTTIPRGWLSQVNTPAFVSHICLHRHSHCAIEPGIM